MGYLANFGKSHMTFFFNSRTSLGFFRREKQKFNSGESSLFLVNSRETKLIEAQLKLVELSSKYNIATRGMDWAVGGL